MRLVRRHGMMLALLLVCVATSIALYLLEQTRSRIERVETRVRVVETTVEHRIMTPCLETNDRACRLFLNRLLAAATPAQLRRLRGAGAITPQRVRLEIRRFEQDRRAARQARAERQRQRERQRRGSKRRRGVMPDNNPGGQPRAARLNGAWGRPLEPPRLAVP